MKGSHIGLPLKRWLAAVEQGHAGHRCSGATPPEGGISPTRRICSTVARGCTRLDRGSHETQRAFRSHPGNFMVICHVLYGGECSRRCGGSIRRSGRTSGPLGGGFEARCNRSSGRNFAPDRNQAGNEGCRCAGGRRLLQRVVELSGGTSRQGAVDQQRGFRPLER